MVQLTLIEPLGPQLTETQNKVKCCLKGSLQMVNESVELVDENYVRLPLDQGTV